MQAGLCPPIGVTCVFLDAGPQGLTQTHSGSRQMLPAMPSVASWRFPSQSHRPVSAPLLCPPLLWCCGQRRKPAASDSRQLQGCLPHPPAHPPGNHGKIRQTPASCSKRTSWHIVFIRFRQMTVEQNVTIPQRAMFNLIQIPDQTLSVVWSDE